MKTSIFIVRYVLGIIIGLALYAIGFIVGGMITYLLTVFQIYTPSGDVNLPQLFGASVAANLAGFYSFFFISCVKKYGNEKLSLPFPIIQISIAVIYGVFAILSADFVMIWFTIVSIAINAFLLYEIVNSD